MRERRKRLKPLSSRQTRVLMAARLGCVKRSMVTHRGITMLGWNLAGRNVTTTVDSLLDRGELTWVGSLHSPLE